MVQFQDIGWVPELQGYMTGTLMERNISYQTRADAYLFYLWEFVGAQSDYNTFYQTPSRSYLIEDIDGIGVNDLDDWRSLGYDLNSLTTDPLFMDVANDDYRLMGGSPAFGLGFQPIDVNEIGIRP